MSGYQTFLITVRLDSTAGALICTPSSIVVPAKTIATITWGVDSAGGAFSFEDFKWCQEKAFLSRHVVLDRAIVVLVSNRVAANKGDWSYQITAMHDGNEIQSPACGAGGALKQPDATAKMQATRPMIITH